GPCRLAAHGDPCACTTASRGAGVVRLVSRLYSASGKRTRAARDARAVSTGLTQTKWNHSRLNMSVRPIRIFVSSPGDVLPERNIAHDVIRRLDREFSARFRVEGIFWEQEPLVATEHFQTGIVAPSATDVVIAILWSRLG